MIDFNLVPEEDRRANSLIFVATPTESVFAKQAVDATTPNNFNDLDFYMRAGTDIDLAIRNLEVFLDRMTENGKTVAGYSGAGEVL